MLITQPALLNFQTKKPINNLLFLSKFSVLLLIIQTYLLLLDKLTI